MGGPQNSGARGDRPAYLTLTPPRVKNSTWKIGRKQNAQQRKNWKIVIEILGQKILG